MPQTSPSHAPAPTAIRSGARDRVDAPVLVVGSGVAGIACARSLAAAGVAVRVVDKGRGIGGRMATRRVEHGGHMLHFDHGAQYLPDTEAAAAMIAAAPGATAPWDIGDGRPRTVGQPGMSALPRAMAEGVDVAQGVCVTALKPDGAGWRADTEGGAIVASHVVLTVPAPQIAPLLGDAHPVATAAAAVTMLPCLTLMAAFPQGSPAPFETRRDPARALAWIARNDTRLGRASGLRTWVAQAGPDWSAARFGDDRAALATLMLGLLCDELGCDPRDAVHTAVQGWRYGIVDRPLGRPFLRDGTLWAGGDWCLGPKAPDAWQSGRAMAADMLAHASAPPRLRRG